MAILRRRDRMVVFRLTRDEYKRLQKACSSAGARNLSDFTRSRLLDQTASGEIADRLAGFDRRLADLQRAIRRLTALLRRIAHPDSGDRR